MTIVQFVAGLVVLVYGAEIMVRGASRVATTFGISPLVIGLTVVAYGTSAPELAVSVQASLAGQADLAVGNVIGSNISNILLILGLSAVAAPLVVSQQLVRLDVPLMIGVFGLMWFMSVDGRISTLDGAILFAGAIGYTVFAIRKSRKESQKIRDEYEKEYGRKESTSNVKSATWNIVLVVAGIALLGLGANWLVESATSIALALGVSELVIGLTVVAIGTSLPELATSVVASIKGERDIAAGNVVGSNLFNVLSVLGLTALVVPAGVPVASSVLSFDLPIMFVAGLACLPIFFTGFRIDRWEGACFLFFYVAYLLYLGLNAAGHDALPLYSKVMMLFVIPITVLTLLTVTWRAVVRQRGGSNRED
jgi:cation:H+ antiporter